MERLFFCRKKPSFKISDNILGSVGDRVGPAMYSD